MMGFGWLAMTFAALVLVGIVIVGAWAAVHLLHGTFAGRTVGSGAAREILDERYARGELDDEEYDRRRLMLDPWR